jgi:hypothetical protein
LNEDFFRLDLDYGPALALVQNCDLAAYLAVLVRVARVGDVSVEERNLAIPIARDLDAREEETTEALRLADDASLSDLVSRLEHPAVRLCCYRDACRMALADGQVDAAENAALQELAEALNLDVSPVLEDLALMRSLQERFRTRLHHLTCL